MSGIAATYISENSFSAVGNQTTDFNIGRRTRTTCSGVYKYGTVSNSTYSDPNTIITLSTGSDSLDSGTTLVYFGVQADGEGSLPEHTHDSTQGEGGTITFINLSDTPAAYSDGKYLKSNTGTIEFVTPEGVALIAEVKEENISAITKGQMCAITGSSGAKFEVGLCDCDDATKIRVIGLAQTNISQNGEGVVVYKGELLNVDSRTTNTDVNPNAEVWDAGDLLYVSRTPGGLTNTRPSSGRCIKAGRTLKGNSVSDTFLAIVDTNSICACAAAGEDLCHRMGDNAGVNKISYKSYDNNEVGSFDSLGNLTMSGTVDGRDVATDGSKLDGIATGADVTGDNAPQAHNHDGVYYTETEVDTWRNSTTQTEMGYVHGVTSDIQTQMDAKPDTLLELTDTPAAYDTGKYLKSVADGTEWATVSGGDGTTVHSELSNLTYATAGHTGQLTLGEYDLKVDSLLSADGKYSGVTCDGVLGATLTYGDLVYLNTTDQRWEPADADTETTSGDVQLAIVLAGGDDGDTRLLLLNGFVREDDWNFTSYGQALFISCTAGDMTQTVVSGTGDIVRIIGYASTFADQIYFNPCSSWVEIS